MFDITNNSPSPCPSPLFTALSPNITMQPVAVTPDETTTQCILQTKGTQRSGLGDGAIRTNGTSKTAKGICNKFTWQPKSPYLTATQT